MYPEKNLQKMFLLKAVTKQTDLKTILSILTF